MQTHALSLVLAAKNLGVVQVGDHRGHLLGDRKHDAVAVVLDARLDDERQEGVKVILHAHACKKTTA